MTDFTRTVAPDKGYYDHDHKRWVLVLEPCGHVVIRQKAEGWPQDSRLTCERCCRAAVAK
jgi:hypothetical protein